MATVRFSDKLKQDIRNNARRKMEPAVVRAKESRPDNSWGSRIYNTMFQAYIPHLNELPDDWFNTVNEFSIRKVGDKRANLDFSMPNPVKWPKRVPTNEYCFEPQNYYSAGANLTDHEVWAEFKAEVAAYLERVEQAEIRLKEFVNMVDKIINAYTTLAPALKAWPALWELIPEDVKDRHREVKERVKKEVELDVDLNKLTALSAAAKFGV